MIDLIQVAGVQGGSPDITPGLFHEHTSCLTRLYDKGHGRRGSVSGGQGQG